MDDLHDRLSLRIRKKNHFCLSLKRLLIKVWHWDLSLWQVQPQNDGASSRSPCQTPGQKTLPSHQLSASIWDQTGSVPVIFHVMFTIFDVVCTGSNPQPTQNKNKTKTCEERMASDLGECVPYLYNSLQSGPEAQGVICVRQSISWCLWTRHVMMKPWIWSAGMFPQLIHILPRTDRKSTRLNSSHL